MPNQHKGKYSHPTKMPSQNPHDPKPRNPKRTQSCRTESSGHRHQRFERKHERREDEKERLLRGDLGSKASICCFVLYLYDPLANYDALLQPCLPTPVPTGRRTVLRLWRKMRRGRRRGTRSMRSVCARRRSRVRLENRARCAENEEDQNRMLSA